MSAMCWNCRGAGNAATVNELHDLVKKFAPNLLYIVETQIEGSRVENLAGTLGYDKAYVVDSRGRSGGIGIFWNNEIKVDILGYSDYYLDVSVEEPGVDKWRLTCIYGEAQTHLRHQTWTAMKNISTLSTLPWLCMGDFNEVLRSKEHEGIGRRSNAQMQAFPEAIDVCMLLDIGYRGRFWTFEKKVAGGTYTRCRLDRAFGDAQCMSRFPLASLEHLSAASSDHGPILLDFGRAKKPTATRMFRYEAMWETHDGFRDAMSSGWATGSPCATVQELMHKLQNLSGGLT